LLLYCIKAVEPAAQDMLEQLETVHMVNDLPFVAWRKTSQGKDVINV